MCHIQMHAKLDAPCQVAYELIKDEDNARFFRNIDVSPLSRAALVVMQLPPSASTTVGTC